MTPEGAAPQAGDTKAKAESSDVGKDGLRKRRDSDIVVSGNVLQDELGGYKDRNRPTLVGEELEALCKHLCMPSGDPAKPDMVRPLPRSAVGAVEARQKGFRVLTSNGQHLGARTEF